MGSNPASNLKLFMLVSTFSLHLLQLSFLLGGSGFKPQSSAKKLFFLSFFISFCHSPWHSYTRRDLSFFHFKKCIPEEIFHAYHDLVPALTIQTFFQCKEGKKKGYTVDASSKKNYIKHIPGFLCAS